MNLKKSLYVLIITTILFVGCSNYQVKNEGVSLPDEATKQKTMTKVQNNINEIIGKDYDYVISNLGEPNSTSYSIDKNDLEDIATIDDIEELTDIGLIYLKNVSEEDVNSSGLYLQLKNKIVKKAQITDFSKGIVSKNLDKSKILVNHYANGDVVKATNEEIEDLDSFIGIDSSETYKIVGDKQPYYDAYLYNKLYKSIKIYYLNDKDKLLCIFTEANKVSQIDVFDSNQEFVDEIKNIMLNN